MMFLGELAGGLDLIAIAIVLMSLASLLAFVVNGPGTRRLLLDLSVFGESLFGEKKFVLPIISITLLIISSFALFILGPFYFQGVIGYTPSK